MRENIWQKDGKLWHWLVILTWRGGGIVFGHGIEDTEADARQSAFACAERACLNAE